MNHSPLVREKVIDRLKTRIIEMRSDSFIKIDSERSLAENFGVSRISIRTALKDLINEGLLMQIQGKGTYITPMVKINSLHIACSPDIKSNDPYYNKFLVEITNAAAKKSINLFIVNTENINEPSPVSPLILVGCFDQDLLDRFKKVYVDIVAIHEYFDLDDVVQICFDDYRIGWNAAKALMDYGHKNLLHIAGPDKYSSAFYRRKGFMDGAKELGANVETIQGKMNWSGGYQAADTYLKKPLQNNPCTAVFAANDWMAVGFIQKLKETGIKVPDEISIIGCDDIPLASEFYPALSTFNLDMRYLVEEIFSVFGRHVNGEIRSNKRILLPATLVRRKSLVKIKSEKEQ